MFFAISLGLRTNVSPTIGERDYLIDNGLVVGLGWFVNKSHTVVEDSLFADNTVHDYMLGLDVGRVERCEFRNNTVYDPVIGVLKAGVVRDSVFTANSVLLGSIVSYKEEGDANGSI